MEYLTVTEIAEKWGVTPRQVQRLLAAGRIPFAKKHGKSYMIPADAKKPDDPHNPNSGRVMTKCGLKYEGTMRQSDVNNQGICDAAYYAILAEEYFTEGKAALTCKN